MTDQDRIDIAASFISRHKNANLDDWRLGLQDRSRFGLSDNEALLEIYNRMSYGTYSGNTGAETEEYGEFCIEISQHESARGRTELFDWEDEETYRQVTCMDEV